MRRSIISIIFHNFQYKIVALILAFIFWYMVQGEEILEVNQKLIVTFNVPEGFVIKEGNTRIKDVTIRGPRVLVGDAANKPPLEAHITIPPGKSGPLRIRVDKEFIRDWDARKVLTVHDEYVNVFVDEQVVRRVPVREVLQGTPADGYIIEKTEVKPNTVTLTGPKSDINKVQEIFTEPVDITGIQQSKSFEAKLVPIGMDRSGLALDKVIVNVQVGEQKVNKRFANIPIEINGGDFLANVRPKIVSIVIQGTPGVLNFVKRNDLRAFVEVRELGPGRFEKEVQVKIPPDTVLIETFPEKANVEIYNQKRIN